MGDGATGRRTVTRAIFAGAAALAVGAIGLELGAPGGGANLGAGLLALLAIFGGALGTVRTLHDLRPVPASSSPGWPTTGRPGPDRPSRQELAGTAAGAAAVAVLALAAAQFLLALAALVPAVVCGRSAWAGRPDGTGGDRR